MPPSLGVPIEELLCPGRSLDAPRAGAHDAVNAFRGEGITIPCQAGSHGHIEGLRVVADLHGLTGAGKAFCG